MSETWRFAVFFVTVFTIWTAMHAYVLGRLWRLPGLDTPLAHRLLAVGFVVLWLAYPVARVLERRGSYTLAHPLEWVGASWLGTLFFLVFFLLVADLVTGFGWLLPRTAPPVRWAAVAVALSVGAAALIQGSRAPVVEEMTVFSPRLPEQVDGLRVVQLSDLHVGALLGARWVHGIAARVAALSPDLVLVTGDLVDGNAGRVAQVLPQLRTLTARHGVWVVTGNHEYYAGLEASLQVLRDAGFEVLRDGWVEPVPGLILAGVDDLTARRQFGDLDSPLSKALAGRPPGFTVLLSHSPWRVEEATASGVDLMLSGHTHAGQIWPFGYLTALHYPFLEGRFQVGDMVLYVSRGTGTWGPRMRLPRPAEITLFTLRRVP